MKTVKMFLPSVFFIVACFTPSFAACQWIKNVTSTPSSTSAIITWQTCSPSTSQVKYGLTNVYGSITPIDNTLVLSHSQTLTALLPSTIYHYKVISKDSTGTSISAKDKIFTTTGVTKTLNAITTSPGSATILVNGSQQFQATGTYSDGSTANLTNQCAWTTSNATVATVSTGLATGITSGIATIGASLNGMAGSSTLQVNAVVAHSVALSWNDTQTGVTYKVYRSTTSGTGYTNIAANLASLAYTDNIVTSGTTYYYVATANNSSGESLFSNEATAVIP